MKEIQELSSGISLNGSMQCPGRTFGCGYFWDVSNQFVVALVFAVFARPTRLLLVSYTE